MRTSPWSQWGLAGVSSEDARKRLHFQCPLTWPFRPLGQDLVVPAVLKTFAKAQANLRRTLRISDKKPVKTPKLARFAEYIIK